MKFLLDWAAERGYEIGWAPIDILEDIAADFASRAERNEPEQKRRMCEWNFREEAAKSGYPTIVVLSFPQGQLGKAIFPLDGKRHEMGIPPGYILLDEKYARVQRELMGVLEANGVRSLPCEPPLKSLSARVGITKYGRNNITYAGALGSYHALLALLVDRPLSPEAFPRRGEPEVMALCSKCNACQRACETQAFDADRFMVHPARCITQYNESAGAWPDWVPKNAKQYLIGCMTCQGCCPMNRKVVLPVAEPFEFSEEQARALLEGVDESSVLRLEIDALYDRMGLMPYKKTLDQNIRLFLQDT